MRSLRHLRDLHPVGRLRVVRGHGALLAKHPDRAHRLDLRMTPLDADTLRVKLAAARK